MAGSKGPFVPSFQPCINMTPLREVNAASCTRASFFTSVEFSEVVSTCVGSSGADLDLTDISYAPRSSWLDLCSNIEAVVEAALTLLTLEDLVTSFAMSFAMSEGKVGVQGA